MGQEEGGCPDVGWPGGGLPVGGDTRSGVRIDLPLEPGAVHRARVEVATFLESWPGIDGDSVSDAQLAVAELVSNAVRHAGTDVTLELSVDGHHLVIGVCDGSAVLPASRRATSDDEDGRGLLILTAVSQGWGVDSLPGGHKRVWARIELHEGPSPR